MNKRNKFTRTWMREHINPSEVENFINSIILPEIEKQILIKRYIKGESLETIASSLEKVTSYSTVVKLHKKALKRATYARKNLCKKCEKQIQNKDKKK